MNPYNVLGLDISASEEDIKKRYRKLANEHHPDKNHGDLESERKFKEISEAYKSIKDNKYIRQQLNSDIFSSFSDLYRGKSKNTNEPEPNRVYVNLTIADALTHDTFKVETMVTINGTMGKVSFDVKVDDFCLFTNTPHFTKVKTKLGLLDFVIYFNLIIKTNQKINTDGSIEISCQVDANSVISDRKIAVDMPDNKRMEIKIPNGFKSGNSLKISEHGFFNKSLKKKMDVLITPIFKF